MKLIAKKFFRTLAFGILPLVVYLATLAPTITWRNNGADSGDLVTAAFTLGIPHPPGYPLYTLLAAIFSRLPFGEPAQNVAAFSALAAAAAIIFLVRAGYALLGDAPLSNWVVLSVALLLAFAPAAWSQATIPEVNALAACFAAALFAVSLSASPRRAYYAAAILGFGLAHHLTILLLVPSVIILLTRDDSSQTLGAQRAQSFASFFSVFSVTSVVKISVLILAPLTLYAYLPLRAYAHPQVNWGDPQTWDKFLWVVSGAPYRQYLFAVPGSEIFARLGLSARLGFEQFTFVGVAFGVWGAVRMAGDVRVRRVFIALLLAFALVIAYAVSYGSRDSFVYLTPAYFIFALWIMWGINDIARRELLPLPLRERVGVRVRTTLLLALVLLPLYNLIANYTTMNVSNDFTARDYAQTILNNLSDGSVILADGDEHFFALQYYRHVVARDKNQVIVSAELLQYDWYFDNIRREIPRVGALAVQQPDRLIEIVDANLAQARGVYTTTQFDALAAFALERRDSGTYRVLGRLY